ncbi:MAG: HRDC domain-containing protein, partial [Steroidobacteraceae bacterium]|nr:HRDC domain-containing protein [Steroidobacteraceae bacterium]MDW8258307.1 HRDC domain-containing protein [Gammaproteobacteria bacterium]
LLEDCAALAAQSQVAIDPATAWQRLRGVESLDPARRALAQRLAAWREQRAAARNRPRGWILDDHALRALIADPPRDRAALRAVPGLPPSVVERAGDEILAEIAAAQLPARLPPLPKRPRPDPAFDAQVARLAAETRRVAAQLGVQPELLATRRDLVEIARGSTTAAPLSGWRRAVIGERLLEVAQAVADTGA